MERIQKILQHQLFQENLKKNEEAEEGRIFCCHTMSHFLDVARIARILNLEEQIGISNVWIYAAALLHDLGKHLQYTNQIPHEKASGEIASKILKECDFSKQEMEVIVDAVLSHRRQEVMEERSLRGILYRADKLSRACYICQAKADCNWKEDKKNISLLY